MVQRACIYAADKNKLLELLKNDPHIAEVIARFRPCFLLASENEAELESLNYNSVVNIHNSWPSSLTFKAVAAGSSVTVSPEMSQLFVETQPATTWVMNIDCWFLLPEKYEKKLLYSAPHVYCFSSTEVVETI